MRTLVALLHSMAIATLIAMVEKTAWLVKAMRVAFINSGEFLRAFPNAW